VRAATGGGIGWQLWFGGLLALLGGVNIANASLGGLILPLVLVALGGALLLRGMGGRSR
jgi:EamA domain-containing membrane protein RarD